MKTRIALTCLIAVALSGSVQAADLIVPSLPYRPAGPDKVLAGFMQTMLKDKSLSAKQRADVLGKIQRAEKLGDPDIAITESLMAISPDFAKALSLLGDEDIAGAKTLLAKLAKSDNAYLAANAEFFLARAYIAEERYEDALPLFKSLAGPEKSDKTLHAGEALFYKGVCQNNLIDRADALVSFTTFLRQNANASERLLVGAQHMVDELRLIEDGSLWDVQTRMDFSRRHLDLEWTDDPTQTQQTTIITMLDKLIEEAERKENSGGS